MPKLFRIEGYDSFYDLAGGCRGDTYYLNPEHIAFIKETECKRGTRTEIVMDTGYTIYAEEKVKLQELEGNNGQD